MAPEFSDKMTCVANTLKTLQENLQCVICLETLKQPVSTRCGHTFCQPCINRVVKAKNAVCPLCNTRVNRRGIVENEKIKSLVQAVHVLMSAAQNDAVQMGCDDLFALSKESKSSSREGFSPPGNSNTRMVATTSGTKGVSRKSARVETWLQGVAPASPTQEPSPSIVAENTQNVDSDCEMVSVSQIQPDQSFGSTKKKPLSAYIEEDGDADEGSSKKVKVKPKPVPIARATKKNISLKGKGKQESITNYLGKKNIRKSQTSTDSSSTFDTDCTLPGQKIPDPVVVLIDREKENTTNPLPQRSPGWSRINKMKKDFNKPKVLRAVNSKSSTSSMTIIEDGGSGDDQPCFSLTIDSPVMKKRAKIKEIVDNLESEIKIFEKSGQSKENTQNKLLFQPNTCLKLYRPPTDASLLSNQSRIRYYKLGPLSARKRRRVPMPIYLKGPLERLQSFDFSSMGYRLLVDAQTQTVSESETVFLGPRNEKKNSEDVFLSPPSHSKNQHRQSSEFDVDMMDAETVVFSQPLRRPDSIVPETPSYEERREPAEQMKRDDKFSQLSNSDSQRILSDSRWLSQESEFVVHSPPVENSPKRISDIESLSVINPTVDLDDTCSSVLDKNRSKRLRTLATSSDTSDSEVGVSKIKSRKKKKTKKPVLSDNEDSCNNQLDISTVDTEKIMANIEAAIDESRRPEFPDRNIQSSNKGIVPLDPIPKKTFDENLDILSDTSVTQNDSDADSELINPTPQKQTSFSRAITHSDDVVPSSQPSSGSPLPLPFLQAASKVSPEEEPLCIPSTSTKNNVEKSLLQSAGSTADKGHIVEPRSSNTINSPADTALVEKPVFVCSSIPANLTSQVEKLAMLVGGEFSAKFSANTTHLIVRVEEGNKADKTFKYLSAVAHGKWVVSFSWVQNCLEAKKLIPEEPFEALDTSGEPGPRRSRESRMSGKKLFTGFEFCCIGEFADLSKSQLEELLVECGACIVPKPTEFSFQDRIIPICLAQWDEEKEQEYATWLDKYSSPLITHEWVLDCIGKFSVTSFAPMLLCDVTDDVLTSMGIPPALFEFTDTETVE